MRIESDERIIKKEREGRLKGAIVNEMEGTINRYIMYIYL